MSDIDHEMDVYGKVLSGTEAPLELAKLARVNYLKKKMRIPLSRMIGDYADNLADTMKVLILGQAISLGIVTNTTVITKYKTWVQAMLTGYTAAGIQTAAQSMLDGIDALVFKKYDVARAGIAAAETEEAVNAVDIEEAGNGI